jgi:hypothetical protein
MYEYSYIFHCTWHLLLQSFFITDFLCSPYVLKMLLLTHGIYNVIAFVMSSQVVFWVSISVSIFFIVVMLHQPSPSVSSQWICSCRYCSSLELFELKFLSVDLKGSFSSLLYFLSWFLCFKSFRLNLMSDDHLEDCTTFLTLTVICSWGVQLAVVEFLFSQEPSLCYEIF